MINLSRTARSIQKVIFFFLSFCASCFIHALRVREDLRDQHVRYDILYVFFKGIFVIYVPIILVITSHEKPVMAPLRLWIALYGAHCITYLICIYFENQQRRQNLLHWRKYVSLLCNLIIIFKD